MEQRSLLAACLHVLKHLNFKYASSLDSFMHAVRAHQDLLVPGGALRDGRWLIEWLRKARDVFSQLLDVLSLCVSTFQVGTKSRRLQM